VVGMGTGQGTTPYDAQASVQCLSDGGLRHAILVRRKLLKGHGRTVRLRQCIILALTVVTDNRTPYNNTSSIVDCQFLRVFASLSTNVSAYVSAFAAV